jgi:hypothetical protein
MCTPRHCMLRTGMGRVGVVRLSIVVLLVAAQGLSFAFAAGASSFSSRCPIHSGQASTGHQSAHQVGQVAQHADSAVHEHHNADQTATQIDSLDTSAHPAAFGVACCAAHIAGVIGLDKPIVESPRSCRLTTAGEPALMPGEFASVDPPPRPVL